MNTNHNQQFGLALSGGGVRGLAHIGVLKVLEREGMRPGYLSGTSMGAVIGAAYAAGMSPIEIENFTLNQFSLRNMMGLVHLTQPNRGLMDPAKVRDMLTKLIPMDMEFSQLRIPLVVCATDLLYCRSIPLMTGNVLKAVIASSAVPGIFPAVELPPYRLVDGGLLNNLPIDLVYRMGAEKVIGVDVQMELECHADVVNQEQKNGWPNLSPEIYQDVMRSVMIISSRITARNLEVYPPNLLVRPKIPRDVSVLRGFSKASEVIRSGEVAAEKMLPAIEQLIHYDQAKSNLPDPVRMPTQ